MVLTSANGVKAFFDRLYHLGFDSRRLGSCRAAVVGPGTAEAQAAHGIRPDLIPGGYRAEGVVEAFAALDTLGKRCSGPGG